MAKQLFANNVSVSIMEELTAADTTITVSSTARFPTIASGDWIMATIVPSGGSGSNEVVKITAFSGNNLTVVRGQESTTAQSFLFGSFLEIRVTKGSLEELRDFTQTGTGAVLRTKSDKEKDMVSVFDFMTAAQITDVQTRALTLDVSTAFNVATTAARLLGVNVKVPYGSYRISNVTVEDCAIVGEGVQANDAPLDEGTVFSIIDTVNPAFNVKRGAGFSGFSVYYPNQVTSGTPTVYPATFKGNTADTVTQCWFDNLNLINSYKAFIFGDVAKTAGHGRINVRNSTIYGIAGVFELYNMLDVFQVTGCIFTWGTLDAVVGTQTIKNWSAKNGIFAYMDRVDGFQMANSIVFGLQKGFHVTGDYSDMLTVTGTLFDGVPIPITIATSGALATTSFTCCSFNATTTGDAAITTVAFSYDSAHATIPTKTTFTSCSFATSQGSFFTVLGTQVTELLCSGCKFNSIATGTSAAGAFYHVFVNNAAAILNLTGCGLDANNYATGKSVHVTLARDVNIVGNFWRLAETPITVLALAASGLATISGNTSSGTLGAASVSIATAAKGKVLLGVNNWDKPAHTTVGAPKFSARLLAATTVNSAVDTTITFGTEVVDTTDSYSTATSIYTAPLSGVYRFSYRISHDATITPADRWVIKLNTTAREYQQIYSPPAAAVYTVVGSALADMTAGDTAKITVARVTGAGNFVTQVDANLTGFEGELVL